MIINSFFSWFFSGPTPSIALASALIALRVYFYQRNEKRKQKAYELALAYADHFLPLFRIIGAILEEIGMRTYIRRIDSMIRFDNSELNQFLQGWGISLQTINEMLEKINRDVIEMCIAKTGCNIKYRWDYKLISRQAKIDQPMLYRIGFEKMVINVLNELETMAMLFRYNIADESIVYQSLHQSFLSHMVNWFYFISYENYTNESKYYENLIWLYYKWYERKKKKFIQSSKKNRYSHKGKVL